MVQNAVARLLSGVRKYQHISPTLAALHWLPVRFCIDFKVLMMTYKALNGLGPRYLADHLLPPRSTRITRHSQEGWLRGLTPREAQKERTRNRAFSAVAPRPWNGFPSEICLAPSLGIFKSHLKTWLFRQAFPLVNSWILSFCFYPPSWSRYIIVQMFLWLWMLFIFDCGVFIVI